MDLGLFVGGDVDPLLRCEMHVRQRPVHVVRYVLAVSAVRRRRVVPEVFARLGMAGRPVVWFVLVGLAGEEPWVYPVTRLIVTVLVTITLGYLATCAVLVADQLRSKT